MNETRKTLRVGVVGVGNMGRHHVRIVSETPGISLSGLCDPDPGRASEFCSQYGCTGFETVEELLERSDAVSIAAPTSLHLDIARKCVDRGVDVLVEKPLAHSVRAAEELVTISREAGVVLMVGHVERYNPAIDGLIQLLRREDDEIVSIDTRRLAPFDGSRCLDVDVLYDLLIHDVDLALDIADSAVAGVSASGRPVFSSQADVVHARIDFQNGASAVLWAGKCSPKRVRTITVSTRKRFLEADTLTGALRVYTAEELPSMEDGLCFMGETSIEDIPVPREEPLRRELEDFFGAVRNRNAPLVDGERALASMKALDMIAQAMKRD
jgi:predicted dehydrogenase